MADNLQLFKEQETQSVACLKVATNATVADLKSTLHQYHKPIDAALQQIFTPERDETGLQKARRIMGDAVSLVADEDMEVYLTEIQFLLGHWLDDFERQAYGGVTLKQLLQE